MHKKGTRITTYTHERINRIESTVGMIKSNHVSIHQQEQANKNPHISHICVTNAELRQYDLALMPLLGNDRSNL